MVRSLFPSTQTGLSKCDKSGCEACSDISVFVRRNDAVLPSRSLYSAEQSPGMYSGLGDSADNSKIASLQYDLNQATAQRDELQNYVSKLTEALKKSEAENEVHRKAREETNVMFSYLQENSQVKANSGKTDQMVADLQKANSEKGQLRVRVNELEDQLSMQRKARETLEETLQATTLECDALRKRMKDYEDHGAVREVEMVEHKVSMRPGRMLVGLIHLMKTGDGSIWSHP